MRVRCCQRALYTYTCACTHAQVREKSSAGAVLSDEDMQGIMEDIIKGQDLALVAQARALAGRVEPGNLIKLKLPDGTTRCQGMVGLGFRGSD